MAQQASMSTISEADRYVIFECVFDYISDIRDLLSLSLVSKQTRSAVFQSNGLRVLTLQYNLVHCYLNGVDIRGKNREEKLRDGLRCIWIVGKRLKSVCLDRIFSSRCFCDNIVLPLYKSLATTEKRRIETIDIRIGRYCDLPFSLVRDNRHTLRRLCVQFWHPLSVDLCSHLVSRLSLSGPSESESFWSLVQQCERLDSLDLILCDSNNTIFPLELVNVLRHTSLRHLGLKFGYLDDSKSETLQELVDVLSLENLRDNLESLEFDYEISMSFLCPLVKELSSSHTPVVFVNVTVLTFNLLALCCQSDLPINWLSFWTAFPSVKKIEHSFLSHPLFCLKLGSALSQSLSNFCKTYLEVCANRACDIKFEERSAYYDDGEDDEELMSAVAMDATLPEDQDWCVSHNVQIETETRDEKVEKVTLRKDTSTLVFSFKFLEA